MLFRLVRLNGKYTVFKSESVDYFGDNYCKFDVCFGFRCVRKHRVSSLSSAFSLYGSLNTRGLYISRYFLLYLGLLGNCWVSKVVLLYALRIVSILSLINFPVLNCELLFFPSNKVLELGLFGYEAILIAFCCSSNLHLFPRDVSPDIHNKL